MVSFDTAVSNAWASWPAGRRMPISRRRTAVAGIQPPAGDVAAIIGGFRRVRKTRPGAMLCAAQDRRRGERARRKRKLECLRSMVATAGGNYCSVSYKLDRRYCCAHKFTSMSNQPTPDRTAEMSTVNENFAPYAHAERELCDIVGPLLADVVKEVEQRNGIKIRELRVTIEPPSSNDLWTGANCVIVR